MSGSTAQNLAYLRRVLNSVPEGDYSSTVAATIAAARNDRWMRPASGADASSPAGGVNALFAEGAAFKFNLFAQFCDGFGNPCNSGDVIEVQIVDFGTRTNVAIQADLSVMPTFLLAAETGTNPVTGVAWGGTPEAGIVANHAELMGTTTTRRGSLFTIVPDSNGFIAKGFTMTAAGTIQCIVSHRTWRRRFSVVVA